MKEAEQELRDVVLAIDDAWIREHTQVRYNGLKNEPYQMPPDHPFTDALRASLRTLGVEPEVGAMMASTDGRYYYNQGGMPSVMYGGNGNGTSHARDEYAEIPDVLQTALEYAVLIADWCAVEG